MKEEKRVICFIQGESMRDLMEGARKLDIKQENIVQFFSLRDSIYLIYYK